MAINYPTSLDNFTNPTSSSPINSPSHADQHANANDAIEALEAKVGVTGSAVTTSHDYKIAQLESLVTSSVAGAKSIYQDVRNQSGSALSKATPVYISGSEGASGKMLISAASNAAESTSSKTMGITTSAIADNSNGQVISEGILEGIDTTGAADGDPVWLGVNGAKIYGLVNKPSAPSHLVFLGVVIRGGQANTGSMYVKIQNGFEIEELHNVEVASKVNGNILAYDSTSETWKNTNTLQSTASVIPLIIKGSDSQTADLQQWQDSSGTVKTYIRRYGQIISGDFTNAQISITGQFTSNPVAVIRGAISQTANLQEWQNSSGSVLANVSSSGGFGILAIGNPGGVGPYQSFNSTNITITSRGPSNTGFIIKAAASQTANLQEWQDSSGTVLASINSAGLFNNSTSGIITKYVRLGGSSYLGTLSLTTETASTIGAVIRGSDSQTANLQEWQTSGGTAKTYVAGSGSLVSVAAYLSVAYLGSGITGTIGQANVTPFSASTIGLVVRGAASQTANLQEWQNSAGTALTNIDSTGRIVSTIGLYTSAKVSIGGASWSGGNGNLNVFSTSTSNPTTVIRSVSSQTSNLTEWQNSSGTVLAKVDTNGSITAGTNLIVGNATMLYTGGNYYNSTLSILTQDAEYSGIVVRGQASQTANLQEWQDSAGTVYARVRPSGQIGIGSTLITGTNFFVNNTISTTNVVATIRGAASQTANLQEWQNSSGSIISYVTASGAITSNTSVTATSFVKNGGTSSQFLKADGSVDSSTYVSTSSSYIAGHHPEGRILASAALVNDLGNARLRGSTFTFTNISPADADIDKMFDGTANFLIVSPTSSQTFPIVIEFTLPRTLSWGATVGVGFGLSTWRANSVKIEAFSNGAWVTCIDTTTNTSEDVIAGIPGPNSSGTTKLRYTFANPNSSQLRICHLWAYNYNSDMWTQLQMPRSGGTMYGALSTKGVISVLDSSNTTTISLNQDGSGAVAKADPYGGTSWNSYGNLDVRTSGSSGGYSGIVTIGSATQASSTPALVLRGHTEFGSLTNSSPMQVWQKADGTLLAKVDQFGAFTVNVNSASSIPLILKGAASQTANLQEWQNSSGTVLASIIAGGNIRGFAGLYGNNTSDTSSYPLYVTNSVTSTVVSVIKGAASQTADLQQWQDSAGTVQASVLSNGRTTIRSSGSDYGASLSVGTNSTSAIGIVVRGVTSQSSDLQQWQATGGTVLAKVDASGFFSLGASTSPGGILGITASLPTYRPLVIKAAESQTANLTEWQNSSGALFARITEGGIAMFPKYWDSATQGASGARIHLSAPSASNQVAIFRGAASQTANLQEWHNSSGTTLSFINPSGMLMTPYILGSDTLGAIAISTGRNVGLATGSAANYGGGSAVVFVGNASTVPTTNPTNGGILYVSSGSLNYMGTSNVPQQIIGSDGSVKFTSPSASVIPLVIQHAGSPTSSYFEIKNSSGTSIWGINSSGEYLKRTTTKYGANIQNDSNNNYNALYIQGDVNGTGIPLYVKLGSGTKDIVKFDNGGTVKLSITSDGSLKGGNSSTVSVNTATTVDTVALSSFTTIEYTISIKQGSKIRSSKVLVHTDGTSVDSTEYGIMEMGGGITGILVSASVSGTDSILQITITDADTTNATVKLIKTML